MKDKIEVHLHTNDNCNLKCIHCYNKSGGESACNIPESGCLLELIRFFCTRYDVEIHLEGGEIFLRPELLRKMNELPLEMLQCITVTTNGTIRIEEPEIIDMLCKLQALRISVEGHTDEQQHMVRGIALKEVVENALFYKKEHIPVWMRLTLTCQNYEQLLAETLPYYMEMGFQDFQVYEFQSVGRGVSSAKQLAVDNRAFCSFLEKLETWKEFPDKEELNLKFMFSSERENAVFSHEQKLKSNGLKVFKLPAEDGVSIHADGAVYLCAWDNDERHCILNVYKEGIDCMEAKLKHMSLKHSCSHCSTVCIAYGVRYQV